MPTIISSFPQFPFTPSLEEQRPQGRSCAAILLPSSWTKVPSASVPIIK